MPSFPWPMRQDESRMTDNALAALLAGKEPPADPVTGLQPVADVLAALRASVTGEELAGEASALTAFRQWTGVSAQTQRSHHRRRPLLTSLLRARVAATALAAILGAAATAAYANALPAPIQRLAHDVIGAPASAGQPTSHPTPSGSPVGPNATGPAAFGLCTAFAHAKAHGTASQQAVAFRNLAAAAGGASKVAGFCAAVPHPGASSHPTPHATGKPTSHPTGKPTAHPTPHATGKPTSHPTGKPTAHPTPHPTGKPTSHP